MTDEGDSLAVTVPQAAELLNVSEDTVRRSIRRGDIPFLRLDRRIVVPRVAMARLLEEAS